VPVVNVVSEKMTPGGAANVALNLKRLGIETTLFGIIGADKEGSFLENYLKESNIGSYLLKMQTHYCKNQSDRCKPAGCQNRQGSIP